MRLSLAFITSIGRGNSRDQFGVTVAKTFALAIDEAAKLHPVAELLIVQRAIGI
jgi:hypothetical protein